MALHQRLLRDIAELQTKPYPNINYIPYEDDVTKGCLILTPNGEYQLHLTVRLPKDFPLHPPSITMQSKISHPNIFDSYICASILNTQEGYTQAYTLKGIAIQLLSFLSSDTLEQEHGGVVDLQSYRKRDTRMFDWISWSGRPFRCHVCPFDGTSASPAQVPPRMSDSMEPATYASGPEISTTSGLARPSENLHHTKQLPAQGLEEVEPTNLSSMPDEVLSLICSALETEELLVFARAWDHVGGSQGIVSRFNLIRNRELLCFCLKKGFEETQLGVGVHLGGNSRQLTLSSEFDLLSRQAFENFSVRRSVQGLSFENWIPLPLSRKHYISVRDEVVPRLNILRQNARIDGGRPVDVIFNFMNGIVIKLSADSQGVDRSTLGRASEKAIESYFHLFHLLLCQATEDPTIVRKINQTLQDVLKGRCDKQQVPNLGHLLISVLISDADMTQDLLLAIIRETIIRNVVWMLDRKGSGMPELAYMEADTISQYRLKKTFEASTTSYRLLMFLNLFRRTINRGEGASRKSLIQMRDELFDVHGAPPKGTAAKLANDIRGLQQIDSFPGFFFVMGVTAPAASTFTTFLRTCMEESVRKGYSSWGISQERALTLRRQKDPNVQINDNPKLEWQQGGGSFEINFFPNRQRGGGGRGGRGRGRGR